MFISVCQRSEIESKSQHIRIFEKAYPVYISMSKIRNWKQITTRNILYSARMSLYQYVKDQKLKANHNHPPCLPPGSSFISVCQRSEIESKSQRQGREWQIPLCLYQYVKDQKLKANHNINKIAPIPAPFISVCQRSEIESKSQLLLNSSRFYHCLYQYVKDQKLKANHNTINIFILPIWVYISMSKIRNWKQITTHN